MYQLFRPKPEFFFQSALTSTIQTHFDNFFFKVRDFVPKFLQNFEVLNFFKVRCNMALGFLLQGYFLILQVKDNAWCFVLT